MSIRVFFRRISQVNWFKTIWLNLTKLPFSQGRRLPVIVCNHAVIKVHRGGVILDSQISFGMVVLGNQDIPTQDRSRKRMIIEIQKNGYLRIQGKTRIGGGVELLVTNGSELVLGNDFYLSLNSTIYCHKRIVFGESCTIAWNVLIMDSDWHRTFDPTTKECFPTTEPIVIGNHCWICNDVQIQKGTEIPDNVIVASKSLCNKKYDVPQYSLLAGIPAKLKKENIGYVR